MLYVIPGYGHTAKMSEYLSIKKCAQRKGYKVSIVSIDWTTPISQQLISLKKDDVVVGFSLGAIIARLSYKKTPCRKIIFGSETPLYKITKHDIFSVTNKNNIFTEDLMVIKRNIAKYKISSKNCIWLSGEQEGLRGKKIKGAGHELTKIYIQEICSLL